MVTEFINGLIEFSDTNVDLLPEDDDDESTLTAKLVRARRERDTEAEEYLLAALNDRDG